MDEVEELIAELRAKAWQSSRPTRGGKTARDHVCWRAAEALTVSPEKLSEASRAIYRLRLENASSHDVARAAAIALGLKVDE